MDYTIKAGDTLSGIAAANNTDVATLAKINNIPNPDKIQAGATIKLSAGPTVSEVPGIGTLTVTPKGIPTAPPKDTSGVGDNAAGLYERTGVTPPVLPKAPSAPLADQPIPGLPSYPSGLDNSASIETIRKSYNDLKDTISSLESSIASAAVSSPEEQQLQKELAAKKAQLGAFDLESLAGTEALSGQGRGISTATIARQDQKLQRTRALERLGLAQEADTLTTSLSLAQDRRKQLGDVARTQYDLATKKLDIALGIESKISALGEKQRDNARQYLLDLTNFSAGKTYDQLDDATRSAITTAVANSPITLDMVKTALVHAAKKQAASEQGNLRTVPGVGVVEIDPTTNRYKVVVPENPDNHTPPAPSVPSFNEYLSQQNLPIPSLTPERLTALRSEYDAKYATTPNVSTGKLTATNKQDLTQAGLSTAQPAVQSYFLNAPSAFRDAYNQDVAAGKAKPNASLNDMVKSYTDWYNANKKKSGKHDWAALLGTQ